MCAHPLSFSQGPPEAVRTDFIDRLRVVLTALVVAHHGAITYGASGDWFYRDTPGAASASGALLTVFTAVNQTFFMGLFFLLAGYHTPTSWRRKGSVRFITDRCLRLGVPLLLFGFVLGPLSVALAGLPASQGVLGPWVDLMVQGRFVIGPLWFAFALLLFSIGWVCWASWRRSSAGLSNNATWPMPSFWTCLVAALGVGAVALFVRQWWPVGQSVLGLQLGYFPSYVFLFAVGCKAAGGHWLERIEPRQARQWGRMAWLAFPALFVAVALEGGLQGRAVHFQGGLGLAAVVYALWEPLLAWGIILNLLLVFRFRVQQPSERWRRWSQNAYGAFFLHAPVLVGLAVLASSWQAPTLVKFCFVVPAAIVLSFWLARWLRAMPGASHVW